MVWPLTKPPNSRSHSRGGLHNPVWPLTSTSNFLTPKRGMDSTGTQNIDPILGRLHKTLPISTTFPNIQPVPQSYLRIQRYMSILQTTYHWCPDPSRARNWKTHRKIYPTIKILRFTTASTSYYKFHSQKFCLLSNFIHERPKILIVPQFETCFYNLSLFEISQKQYFLFLSLPSSFPLSWFIVPKHSSKLYQLICKIYWILSPISNFLL